MLEIGIACPRSKPAYSVEEAHEVVEGDRLPRDNEGRLHARREGRRGRQEREGARRDSPEGAQPEHGAPGPHRGVHRPLEADRVRGDAGRGRQRADSLQHGERPEHEGAHRGQHRRRALADDNQPRVPHAPVALPQGREEVRDSGGVQHAVRPRAQLRDLPRHRDQREALQVVGARLQGDGISHRVHRGEDLPRLLADRAEEQGDRRDHGDVRALARLRRPEDAQVGHEEVRGGLEGDRDGDEVDRRGDGDRAGLRGGDPEGRADAQHQVRRRDKAPPRGGRRRGPEGPAEEPRPTR